MKKLLTIFLNSFILLLSGCFYTSQYQPAPALIPSNAAKIYIIRPSSMLGIAINVPVYVNGKQIGRLGNKGQLSEIVKPGSVTVSTTPGIGVIATEDGVISQVVIKAKPGKTYYVELTLPFQVSILTPGAALQILDQDSGKNLLKQVS